MKWSLTFSGGAELAQRLRVLAVAVTRKILVAALKEAAEPIRARAEYLAPHSHRLGPHLHDHIVIQTVTRVGSVAGGRWQSSGGEPWVAVGPAKQYFYGIFQEYGTKYHSAHAFMRPAFETGGPAGLPILSAHIWQALEKKVPTSSSLPMAA